LQERLQWQRKIAKQVSGRRIFFLDESGIQLNLTRLYGRAPGGRRAIGSTPKNYGRQLNVLGAMSRRGVQASMTVLGSVDSIVMTVFIREVLSSVVQAGDIVVLDNLSVHKTKSVQAEFAHLEIDLWYLPPYSPDLNPIEKCWSKVKTRLRGAKARDYETLNKELGIALNQVSESDAVNWIRGCGYV
jgi:transposase